MAVPVNLLIGNPTVVNFNPNSNVQQQLQNNYAMDYVHFRLSGTATLASYSAAPSAYVEAIENLIATFSLTATGKSAGGTTDTITSVDGPFLRFKNRIMEGTDVTRVNVGTANGTYNFETNLKKYFIDPRSNLPYLTRMFSSLLSSLTAGFQFRDATAMYYGGTGGTAALSNVQVTTEARCYLGLPIPSPSPYVKETQRYTPILASQNLLRNSSGVPVGNILRRQYFKGLLGAVNYADPSNTVFGATGKTEGPHLQLNLNNAFLRFDRVYQQLVADNKTMFKQESMPTGWAVFEPAENGRLAAAMQMRGVQNADNYLDVNYTSGSINGIQITDEQLVGVSDAQFAAG